MKSAILEKFEINYFDYNKNPLKYKELAEKIITDLNTVGYIVVQNFDIDPQDIESSKEKFLEISKLVGDPIGHDKDGKIIWDIKSNPKSESFIKTYSEHTHEAQLHTDSQYSYYPEDYFGLLTLKKANCGGGISSLLSLKDILEALRQLPNGTEIEKILSETDYPFIIPNVFKKVQSDKPEFNFGPILRENEIRFRVDTFEKALSHTEAVCSDKQLDAYYKLKEVILNHKMLGEFFLEPKDLIFINNKTMLHGRAEFEDHTRHLLRIRMNKFNAPIFND